MNAKKFRNDVKKFLQAGNKQCDLVRLSGVPQSTLASFINNDVRGISLNVAAKLWPIIYGKRGAQPKDIDA